MIDHMSTYATDFARTKAFYEAAFDALGYAPQMELVAEWNPEFSTQRMCAFGPPGKPAFWVIETKQQCTPRHVAFSAGSRSVVDVFHARALSSGGRDNGAPGIRVMYHENYYGAFVIDPDGNNIEAVCHEPE
ncbi:glyoxalase [Alloalcanivorax dieselolei]|uniref:VOC family protein n=1 Tax=Alloalcanivorax dieselolei TaxID=285091 RepID=UPI00059FAA47|nr:VOC family protein [Alloalcanivorax dieselolei]GGK10481.1 glyoxalase [Alloalcanivorax dieselolei]